jgi:hypothetical protein
MNKADARREAARRDAQSAKRSTTAIPAPAVEPDPSRGAIDELKDTPRKPKGAAVPKRKKPFVL